MWFCRKFFCAVAMVILCIFAYRYKDFATLNNKLLLEIKRQNSELCQALNIGKDISLFLSLTLTAKGNKVQQQKSAKHVDSNKIHQV